MTTPDDLLAEAERLDREAMAWVTDGARVHGGSAKTPVPTVSHTSVAATAAQVVCFRELVPALARRAREQEETIRRLSLALAEEQARSANRAASLDAVREALGDAAGQTGTLAEDVTALVNVVESVRGLPVSWRNEAGEARSAMNYNSVVSTTATDAEAQALEDCAQELERALLAGRKEG